MKNSAKWLEKNKASELFRIEDMFTVLENAEDSLAQLDTMAKEKDGYLLQYYIVLFQKACSTQAFMLE